MRAIYCIVLICLNIYNIQAQNVLKGIIKDADNNMPLPFASIYIKGTYIGTTSNQNGFYSLVIPRIDSEVIVSFIGYETKKIEINKPGIQEVDIFLKPIAVELSTVVVNANDEDPALSIMEKVIANKQKWREKLKSFRAKAYTLSKVENDTNIVSISESISNLYWDSVLGAREEFVKKHSSKQMSYLTELNVGSKNIYNFYDDDIEMFNYKFIGPTNPEANKYYSFKLIGERRLDDKKVFDISVEPKSDLQPLFSGSISVLDEKFAMVDANLENKGNLSFATMLKDFYGIYRQQYNNFGGEYWLPIDSRIEERFQVDMGLLAFPEAVMTKVSRISDYEININVADKIASLDKEYLAKKDSELSNFNQSIFNEFEGLPLTPKERKLFDDPDTTMTLIKSFKPTGILAPYIKDQEKELENSLREQGGYNPIQSNTGFGFQGWYNRIEGLNLGIKYDYQLTNHFLLELTGGYQTFPHKFYYKTQVNYLINNHDRFKYLFASYYDKTDVRYSSNHFSQLYTSFEPLTGHYDYFDYYYNKKLIIGFQFGIENLKTEISLGLSREYNSTLSNISNWNIFKSDYIQRKNPTIDEGRITSILFSGKYDEAYKESGLGKIFGNSTNKFEIQMEITSRQFLKSDFDFTQFKMITDYSIPTFFLRRQDYNSLRIRIEASYNIGTIPLQRFQILDGRIYSYSVFGTFKTLVNKPIEGEKVFGLFWEYNFQSIPFEILNLHYFSENKDELLIHGASGRTWISKERLNSIKNNYIPNYYNEFRHELGLSIIMKFKFFSIRLDGTRDLTNNNYYLGFALNLLSMSF